MNVAVSRLLVALVWVLAASVQAAPEPTPPLRLHPDLPLVLERTWIERLDLFGEVDQLRTVTFLRSAWGGVQARLETETGVLERSLAASTWQQLQQRAAAVLAGAEPPVARPVVDPGAKLPRSWPEAPPPPVAPPRELIANGEAIPAGGRWLAIIELGTRLDVSSFNTYFSPMGQVGIAFARGITDHLFPELGFYAGFGDMRGEFQDAFGDGRANAFGFTLATLFEVPLTKRHGMYVEVGGGYHLRSLYWGGLFVDPRTGTVSEGRVLEQKDFGWNLRLGWLIHRAGRDRPRLLDIGLGVQRTPAESWTFWVDDSFFEASDHDTWVALTVRIWDGL